MGRPKKKRVEDLEWYVYNYNDHKNKIEPLNIFDHWKLCEDIEKWRKQSKTREYFMKEVKKELRYYFWSKSEYELIIQFEDGRVLLLPWCGCRNPEEVAKDVTYENPEWEHFAEYHISRQIYGNKAKIDIYEQIVWLWDEFAIWICDELGVE
jgi:hypothetical protein